MRFEVKRNSFPFIMGFSLWKRLLLVFRSSCGSKDQFREAFGTAVKWPLGMPPCHVGVHGSNPGSYSPCLASCESTPRR